MVTITILTCVLVVVYTCLFIAMKIAILNRDKTISQKNKIILQKDKEIYTYRYSLRYAQGRVVELEKRIADNGEDKKILRGRKFKKI